MPNSRFRALAYLATVVLYVLGAWLHLPYAGHVYSGLIDVFQSRECLNLVEGVPSYAQAHAGSTCDITIPYIQSFIEYPVLSAMFLYANAVLGSVFPGGLIANYYLLSAFFLLFPTLLAARELLALAELRGVSRNRVLWYFVLTPTLIFMTLLSWYVIGVYLALFGIRKYLGGSRGAAGVLFGLSAAFNLVTAAPAIGLLVASKGVRERLLLTLASLGTYAAINAPFAVLNPKQWLASWKYIYNWNIEDSWIRAFLPLYSPYRHDIPPVVFGVVVLAMAWLRFRKGVADPLVFAFMSTFGYIFATYVDPPQLGLMLLPFFVLLPVSGSYLEFLTFDTMNSLIIIGGFSLAIYVPGSAYPGYLPVYWTEINKPVELWIGVIRSLWTGKFLFFNGSWSILPSKWRRNRRLQTGAHESAAGT